MSFFKKVFFLVFLAKAVYAESLKKVLVLDFKNILGYPEYQYLENSLTDAVKNSLKERYVFEESRREDWQEVAKEFHIPEAEVYTYTAAMNLGIYAKQDVVIFGGFFASDPKSTSNFKMNTRVRILDIGRKKEIADFTITNPIDNTIFNSVEKIADRIVKEASVILPTKEDVAKGHFKREIPSFNQLSIRGTFVPIAIEKAGEIGTNSSFTSMNFPNQWGALLDYHYFGILHESFGFLFGVGFQRGNNKLTLAIDKSQVSTSIQSLYTLTGLAWYQKLTKVLYMKPWLGFGVQQDSMTLQYESDTVNVLNPTGQIVNQKEHKVFLPFLTLGLRFGYSLNKWLSLEGGLRYGVYFFKGSEGQMTALDFGVVFRL